MAVSYTHLDVYKRQGLLCSAAVLHEPLGAPLLLGMVLIVAGITAGVLDKAAR